jgi:hypothetical protein
LGCAFRGSGAWRFRLDGFMDPESSGTLARAHEVGILEAELAVRDTESLRKAEAERGERWDWLDLRY